MKLKMSINSELLPLTEADKIALEKLKGGDILECKKKSNRSNPQLKMLWSIAKVVVDNSEKFKMGKAAEVLMDITKLELDYCYHCSINGKIRTIAKSISFSAMKPEEFNQFCNDAYDLWSRMLGCTVADLVAQGNSNA